MSQGSSHKGSEGPPFIPQGIFYPGEVLSGERVRLSIVKGKQNGNTQQAMGASSVFVSRQAFVFPSLLLLLTIDNQLFLAAQTFKKPSSTVLPTAIIDGGHL